MKIVKLALLIIVISIFTIFIYKIRSPKKTLRINENIVNIELADTTYKQLKGLMFRWYLPKNNGMIFSFDRPGRHGFWMKNTKIPLDMLWLDENFTIVHIQHSALPCKETPCKTYAAPEPTAVYVLEVNGGWSIEKDIKVGMTAEVNL